MKLPGIKGPTKFNATQPAILAAISTRVLIEFESRQGSTKQLKIVLIESHMRIALASQGTENFFHSGTPSEPIFAEVAAQFMDEKISPEVPRLLVNYLSDGLIDKGEGGGLAARLPRGLFVADNCQRLFTLKSAARLPVTRGRLPTMSDSPF